MITIIAAVTKDRGLGKGGDMLYHISADLRRFKELTMGHPVVMGRRTFESLPKGALPGRRNIVVTRTPGYSAPGIETFPSVEEAIQAATAADPEVFIIGGGAVYAQTMPLADRLEITEIDAVAPDADTLFPEIDPARWTLLQASEPQADPKTGVQFRFLTYGLHS